MEETGIRYVFFDEPKVYALLKEKNELVGKIRVMQGEIDKLAAEGGKLGAKINKIKDKANALMDEKIKSISLGEFEQVHTYQIEGDRISATVWDMIEAEKQRLRNEKRKKNG